MKATEKLNNRIEMGLHICVGLDTDITKIPPHLLDFENPVLEFNRIIIESTAESAAAYKLNFAFYESQGSKGFETLFETVELIPKDILVIGDAKRGDIGNTSKMYAQSLFDEFGFDASTLNPYMGIDSIKPFLDYKEKLNFILALTSNPSAMDFEKQKLSNGNFLYEEVVKKAVEWNSNNNCGLVFGATNAKELSDSVRSFSNMPILLPGIGAQGGSLSEVVQIFNNNNHSQFIVNSSRAVIYSDSSENFGNSALDVLNKYNETIKSII